jgi:hypothetical protein
MDQLDHVVLAVSDLEKAKTEFESQTGVLPADGGPHDGLGTRNALVSFDNGVYLEIIAPDTEQKIDDTLGERLSKLSSPRLLHWAIRTKKLNRVYDRADEAGLHPGQVKAMSRNVPGGNRISWEVIGIGGHELGGCVPFYIDWLKAPHPTKSIPFVGQLESFQVSLPPESPARKLLNQTPKYVEIVDGNPRISLSFKSKNGTIKLDEINPKGFDF